MKIAVASDHAAIEERLALILALREHGHEVEDFGCAPGESVDYPDYAEKVAVSVRDGKASRGILLCGTGIGICMAAGKVEGIRSATIADPWSAEMTRRHNDANVGCFGARIHSSAAIIRMAEIFLATPFDGGRHQRRVDKIMALERQPSA